LPAKRRPATMMRTTGTSPSTALQARRKNSRTILATRNLGLEGMQASHWPPGDPTPRGPATPAQQAAHRTETGQRTLGGSWMELTEIDFSCRALTGSDNRSQHCCTRAGSRNVDVARSELVEQTLLRP
jgi:hypothetical protein